MGRRRAPTTTTSVRLWTTSVLGGFVFQNSNILNACGLDASVSWRGGDPPFVVASDDSARSFAALEECTEETRDALQDAQTWLATNVKWTLDESDRDRFAENAQGERTATFGHATVQGAASMIAEWRRLRRPGSVEQQSTQHHHHTFADLGAGAGHVALYGAILDRDAVFRGVEMAPTRVDVARRALAHLDASHPELRLSDRVFFEEGDMLRTDLTNVTGVFASSLMLGDALRRRLAAKLRADLRPGAVVISSSDLLDVGTTGDSKLRDLPTVFVAPMSWSPSHILYSRVVPPPGSRPETAEEDDDVQQQQQHHRRRDAAVDLVDSSLGRVAS